MCRSVLLLITGVFGSASNLYDWNGCKTSDTTCQCGMPGTSASGRATTVEIDEAYCQTLIDAGNATAYVSDGSCKGKCDEGIGCYGTDGSNKGHGVCACHFNKATCDRYVDDGKATMWSHRCSNCAPYTSGCYGTDGETKGHGVCACSMKVEVNGRMRARAMTEEKCQEMVDAGNATMYSHQCHGLCAETMGCYGTDGETKGHGVCACAITEAQCDALVADGKATMWSFSCAGLCADLGTDTTAAPTDAATTAAATTDAAEDPIDSGASVALLGALAWIIG